MNLNNWYCQVFLDTDDSPLPILESILGSKAAPFTIQHPLMEVDIERNEDFHPLERYSDFLFFRYYLDIEPTPNTGESDYIDLIGAILVHLWQNKIPAVAACDFEDRLPNQGHRQYFGD